MLCAACRICTLQPYQIIRRKNENLGEIMVLLEFSMSPLGKGDSVSQYVARSLEIIDASGLDYELHSMGTIVEGEIDEVLGVMRKCLEAMATDCDRVSCSAKLDYRAGHRGRIRAKVHSVEEKLARPLSRITPDADGETR